MEGEADVQQYGAELAGSAQHVEAGADGALVLGRAGGGESDVVGEAPPKFRGKNKAAITGDEVNPLLGSLQFERLVKRSIDFDGVEKLGQIRGLMERSEERRVGKGRRYL